MKVAVIPARGGSKRIPGKNIRDFLGKPIVGYSIKAALDCGLFDEVVVSTDDPSVSAVANEYGATTPFMRPRSIADDHAPVLDVLRHAVDWFASQGRPIDHVCLIYATAPFLRGEDIKAGLEALDKTQCGSSMSVAKFNYPIQRALSVAPSGALEMIQKEHMMTRSQDLPEAYMDAAQFIWTTPAVLSECQLSLLEKGVAPVVLPSSRVQDIDTPEDWDRAELLYEAMQRRQDA